MIKVEYMTMAASAENWAQVLGKLFVCAGVALLPVLAQAATEDDPWESFNRPVFTFNDTLDTYALKPLAQGYQAVTPQFIEDGIRNMFSNVGDVGNLANNLLQGKVHAAGVDTSRLIFNTTFGLLGFFDVASKMDLRKSDEDFGQTFGVWGVSSGPYLVLPLLGPSSGRDAVSKIPDSLLQMYPYIADVPARNSIHGLDVVDTRASLLSVEKLIRGDKYVFIRNAYLQNREFKVTDGQVVDDF
jgi:phospholipid-binding lipoprotein MlaA